MLNSRGRKSNSSPSAKRVAPFRTTFAVPSGVIVFSNHFEFVPECESEATARGIVQWMQARFRHYAALRVPTGCCGNSCPGIYQKGDTLVVGTEYYDYDDEGNGDDQPAKTFTGFVRRGSVTTDVWQWQCGDRSHLEKMAGAAFGDRHMLSVQVTPGIYSVVSRFHCKDWDEVEDVHPFATIRRIS